MSVCVCVCACVYVCVCMCVIVCVWGVSGVFRSLSCIYIQLLLMYTLSPRYLPGDGQKVTLDIENKSNDKILEEIKKIAAKPEYVCGVCGSVFVQKYVHESVSGSVCGCYDVGCVGVCCWCVCVHCTNTPPSLAVPPSSQDTGEERAV